MAYLDGSGMSYAVNKLKALINAKQAKITAFTVSLPLSGWEDNTLSVSDRNFTIGNYSYIITPSPESIQAYADGEIYADNVNTAGSISFHCSATPTEALTVNVLKIPL